MLNAYIVYELSHPWGWIDCADREAASHAHSLVGFIEASVLDAAIALSLYAEARMQDPHRRPGDGAEPPYDFVRRLPVLFAENFIHSLSHTRPGLNQIMGLGLSSDATITSICAQFDAQFPGLVQIRDSIEHRDERVIGKAHQQTLTPSTDAIPGLAGEGVGLTIIVGLVGDMYNLTAADGSAPGIEISPGTLSPVIDLVQQTFDALPWKKPKGTRTYSPSR